MYSDTIKGVGLYAGGVYGLEFMDANVTLKDWKDLIPKAADTGTIADLSNLKNSPVMIFSYSADYDDMSLPIY